MDKNIILLMGAKSQSRPLDISPELSKIKQQFVVDSKNSIDVEYEPYLTLEVLGDLLRRLTDQVRIIHFAGHSDTNLLITEDEQVYTRHIAGILKTWKIKPALVFINGCNSGGQVEGLIDAGIPCVIATHRPVGNSEAIKFATEFYANLLAQPEEVTFRNAFDRAGALALMNKDREPRSLDIEDIQKVDEGCASWDWGVFSGDTAWPEKNTLLSVLPVTGGIEAAEVVNPLPVGSTWVDGMMKVAWVGGLFVLLGVVFAGYVALSGNGTKGNCSPIISGNVTGDIRQNCGQEQ